MNMDKEIEKIINNVGKEIPDANVETLKQRVSAIPSKENLKKKFFEDGKFIPKRLASFILEKNHFKTVGKTDVLLFYNDGIYHEIGERKVKEITERIMGEDVNIHKVNEVIGHVKRSTYISVDEVNKHENLIHLKNGIFNLEEGKLLDFNPEIVSTVQIPVKYDPEANCPNIKKFLSEILEEEDIPIIQELFGYCLWRDYHIQKAFIFLGEGANGKSTLINLFKKFLGSKNISGVSLQDLDNNRFASSQLFGKLANLHADVPDNALYRTGKFKMLTGGDPITAERKFKDAFEFVNYAKLIFSTNKIPESKDSTDAFFRRWIIITFPNKFTDNPDDDNPDKDPNILEKITTEEELSGLFNWALEGLERLLENGKFSRSETTDQIRLDYEKKSDSLKAFVNDCVENEIGNKITKNNFYNEYVDYCRKHGLPLKSKIQVGRELPEKISVSATRDGSTRYWKGVKIL